MLEVMPYLLCLSQALSRSELKQLKALSEALLRCRGRVTMLGLSRWSGTGGSYRTIQRFYDKSICWLTLNWLLFIGHRAHEEGVYLLAGDETTVTKSGKSTHGLGRFFSSIHARAVKGLGFFSLCLIETSSGEASPLLMEQLDPKMKRRTKMKKSPKRMGKRGRPKGSRDRNRKDVELTDYLKWIQKNIRRTLKKIGNRISVAYFVYDGAFGNNECSQMVKECGLLLISKLQCRSALWYPYSGKYQGKGRRRKYGEKVDYQRLPKEYLKQTSIHNGVEESIYQIEVWHKDFADLLNVTVVQRKRKSDGKSGQIILFSNDLELSSDKMIRYYRLRFQIEFTFRDAKQLWGLEDFMNIREKKVQNASNLSMFMVNLSRVLMKEGSESEITSALDLKARFQASFYVDKIIKNNPEIQRVISIDQLKSSTSAIGCIHPQSIAA